MALLTAHGLGKTHGPQLILENASLTLAPRERVGLVGANGVGKSTLARILAGLEDAEVGEVARTRGATVSYLPQEPEIEPSATPRTYVLAGLSEWQQNKQRYDELTRAIEDAPGEASALAAEQADAAGEIERLGGWDLLHRADAILTKLGIVAPDQPLGTASGGERRRVALARILVAEPALAILDEPTNHLDADTIEWLELYLIEQYPGALLLITHDRYVLDRVVTRTLELEGGQLHSYEGGWEDYLVAKAEREELAGRVDANRRNVLRTELEWMRRQPKARTGKQKARLGRVDELQRSPSATRERTVDLNLEATRSGHTILELGDLVVEVAGRRLIEDLSLQLGKGERIGVLGPNGSGKTTLLRCLAGEYRASAGRLVRGKNTQIAYFEQARAGLVDELSVQDNVALGHADVHFNGRLISIFSYLEKFLFFGDKQRQLVGSLSGGERARVALAKLLLSTANLLLLDEPTNDLDVVTLGALEELLRSFRGTTIVVTHDRYFLDRVATSLLVFEGGGRVVHHPGNYSTLLRLRREALAEKVATAAPSEPPDRAPRARPSRQGLTYAEELELAGLLDLVSEAEARLAELEDKLADPGLYARRGGEVPALRAERDQARVELDKRTLRWEELETKREAGR